MKPLLSKWLTPFGVGLVTAGVMWACVPLAHVVKHALDLPDTLLPNTYTSILYLAGFTLMVALIGAGCGTFVRRACDWPGKGR
jgi:hypothetical protein